MKLFLLPFLFSLTLKAELLPKEITIGFIPSGRVEVMQKGSADLASLLAKQLGVKILVVVAKNYSDLLDLIKQKKVDFAFLTARTYVEAEKKFAVKVLLKKIWNEPFYYSVVMVHKKSPIKKISDLRGKKIAFVDEKSTSGYLYPQVMMKKNKIKNSDFKKVIFSGSHPQSVALIEKNEVDAIAVFSDDLEGKQSAWKKFSQSKAKDSIFRILWISDPIPNDPFCVREDFYEAFPKFTHTLMFTLIDAIESLQDNNEVKEILGAKGFMPATSRQYDAVREMVTELGPQGE